MRTCPPGMLTFYASTKPEPTRFPEDFPDYLTHSCSHHHQNFAAAEKCMRARFATEEDATIIYWQFGILHGIVPGRRVYR